MHSLTWPSSSYESRVVKETRSLVESHLPIHKKVALLESAIADEERHVTALQQNVPLADERRRTRLQTAIDLRRRAIAHFRMTVKSLMVQSEGPEAMSKYGVVANGQRENTGDFPFMEYSS